MTRERYVRLVAGSLVLLSLLLYHVSSHYWLWLTAFVGANLFQSSLTKWCLLEDILRKFFGVKSEAEMCAKKRSQPPSSSFTPTANRLLWEWKGTFSNSFTSGISSSKTLI